MKRFGVLLGLLSAFISVAVTARLIFPVTWSSEIVGGVLRWVSPECPRESREIRATEIVEARGTSEEIANVEFTLSSGECIQLPLLCIGDPHALFSALKQVNPAIRLVYDGKPLSGFEVDRGDVSR